MRFMQILLALINVETLIIKTDMQQANDITDKNNVPDEKIKKGISKSSKSQMKGYPISNLWLKRKLGEKTAK